MNKNLLVAQKIAQAVQDRQGRCYYVGGCVRDKLMGRDNKDIDIEVHGLRPAELSELLSTFGEKVEMGASFGVYGLRHYELDIAMPRSEFATGKGHKEFEVIVDPFIGAEKAARRRDFTVNAMMEDVLTGELLDFFGGREDLERKILRHVDSNSFVEDELRVLRAAQFACRFGFSVADETLKLCSTMALDDLPPERVMGELEKALLGSRRPSVFFEILRETDKLSCWFPELEKSCWTDTMKLIDDAAALRDNAEKPLYFMLAALSVCTEGSETLIRRLTKEKELYEYVMNMCILAFEPSKLQEEQAEAYCWNRMFYSSVCPADLLLLDKAINGDSGRELKLEKLEAYRKLIERPSVMGRDLIAAGLKPGEKFRRLLDYSTELRLRGFDKQSCLEMTLEHAHCAE